RPPWNVPLLAVAYYAVRTGQPWLHLYNAATGEQVRQFTGHTERIHSLAFAGDGRLLVSAADDQTVCVWSLAQLDKYLGKLGVLHGVTVRNSLVVRRVNKNAPALQGLDEFDVVDGFTADGRTRTFTSLRGLYAAAARRKPGTVIDLNVRSADGRAKDPVRVTVGEAISNRTACLLLGVAETSP